MRVNINVSESTKKWFEKKAKDTGISQSSLMAMALSEYIDQKESINSMTNIMTYFQELEKKGAFNNEG